MSKYFWICIYGYWLNDNLEVCLFVCEAQKLLMFSNGVCICDTKAHLNNIHVNLINSKTKEETDTKDWILNQNTCFCF